MGIVLPDRPVLSPQGFEDPLGLVAHLVAQVPRLVLQHQQILALHQDSSFAVLDFVAGVGDAAVDLFRLGTFEVGLEERLLSVDQLCELVQVLFLVDQEGNYLRGDLLYFGFEGGSFLRVAIFDHFEDLLDAVKFQVVHFFVEEQGFLSYIAGQFRERLQSRLGLLVLFSQGFTQLLLFFEHNHHAVMVLLQVLLIEPLVFRNIYLYFSLQKTQLLNGLGLLQLLILLELPLDLLVLLQREEVLQDPGVPDFLVLDEVVEKELQHGLLLLDELDVGGVEPAVLLQVGHLDSGVECAQSCPQPREVFVVALADDVERLHSHRVHHVIRHQERSLHDLVALDDH